MKNLKHSIVTKFITALSEEFKVTEERLNIILNNTINKEIKICGVVKRNGEICQISPRKGDKCSTHTSKKEKEIKSNVKAQGNVIKPGVKENKIQCSHIFTLSPLKGERCQKTLYKKGGGDLCYTHRYQMKRAPKIEEVKPVKDIIEIEDDKPLMKAESVENKDEQGGASPFSREASGLEFGSGGQSPQGGYTQIEKENTQLVEYVCIPEEVEEISITTLDKKYYHILNKHQSMLEIFNNPDIKKCKCPDHSYDSVENTFFSDLRVVYPYLSASSIITSLKRLTSEGVMKYDSDELCTLLKHHSRDLYESIVILNHLKNKRMETFRDSTDEEYISMLYDNMDRIMESFRHLKSPERFEIIKHGFNSIELMMMNYEKIPETDDVDVEWYLSKNNYDDNWRNVTNLTPLFMTVIDMVKNYFSHTHVYIPSLGGGWSFYNTEDSTLDDYLLYFLDNITSNLSTHFQDLFVRQSQTMRGDRPEMTMLLRNIEILTRKDRLLKDLMNLFKKEATYTPKDSDIYKPRKKGVVEEDEMRNILEADYEGEWNEVKRFIFRE